MTSTVDKVRRSTTTWHSSKKRRLSDTSDAAPEFPVRSLTGNVEVGFSRPSLVDLRDTLPRVEASEISPFAGRQTSPGAYTQRNLMSSTPGPSQNPLLSLSHALYGLPDQLVANLGRLGISSIYPWQSSCLLGRGNLTGERNLVYTAPTGGGKSLVADVLMIRRVLERKKAVLVLPYVSLVQEKLRWLRRVFDGIERAEPPNIGNERPLKNSDYDHKAVRVAGFYGGARTRETWIDIDVAVCTIEKANILINTAIEAATLDDLGIVVMDELHMVDDQHRGYIIELLAAKLLCLDQRVQLVGMSATLSDTRKLAGWLGAKFYESKYKPIPVEEFLVCENEIFPVQCTSANENTVHASRGPSSITPVRSIKTSENLALRVPVLNAVMALVAETVSGGHGSLVFCGSRHACESTAKLLSQGMPSMKVVSSEVFKLRKAVLEELEGLATVPLDERLAETVPYGVAFHHAGLTTEERDIVAAAFDSGTLKVIVATCGLAAGINLPARRVILHGVRMGRDLVGPAMLRQMRGRAGRKGKDELGESYVCCHKGEIEDVRSLIDADLTPLESSLSPDRRGFKRALLEVIVIRLATHPSAIQDFIERTLLYHTQGQDAATKAIEIALHELQSGGFVKVKDNNCYEATPLGNATVTSGFSPEDGAFMYCELQRALRAFVLDTELQLFYTFSPINTDAIKIDWSRFCAALDGFDEADIRAMSFCGVSPGFVARQATSTVPFDVTNEADVARCRIYARFYAALQLRDLCHEVPVYVVAQRYAVARGSVQGLAQASQGFAASVVKFCKVMGWDMLAALLEHGMERLAAGARADLLELSKIPFVKSKTARVLWENGYKSLVQLAEGDVESVAQVLLLAQPSRRKTLGDQEQSYLTKMRERAEIVIKAAGRIWQRDMMTMEIEDDL